MSRLADAVAAGTPTSEGWRLVGTARAMEHRFDESDTAFRCALDEIDPSLDLGVWLSWITSAFEYPGDPALAAALAATAMEGRSGVEHDILGAIRLRARRRCESVGPVHAELGETLARPLPPPFDAMTALDFATSGWFLLELHESRRVLDPLLTTEAAGVVEAARARQVDVSLRRWTDGLPTALHAAAAMRTWAADTGHLDAINLAATARAITIARTGVSAAATTALLDLTDRLDAANDQPSIPAVLGELAVSASARAATDPIARRAVDRIEALPGSAQWVPRACLEWARSRLLRRVSDETGCRTAIDEAIDLARRDEITFYELLCRRERLWWFGASAADVERIEAIADRAGGTLPLLVAAEASALAADDPVRLAEVSSTAAAAGLVQTAWECAAAAHRASRRRDELRGALLAQLRYESLAHVFVGQDSPTAGWVEPVLTERERKVAALVATGATNPEVAEALYLSRHTVKRHLERIYRTLRISGRDELGSLIRDGTADDSAGVVASLVDLAPPEVRRPSPSGGAAGPGRGAIPPPDS